MASHVTTPRLSHPICVNDADKYGIDGWRWVLGERGIPLHQCPPPRLSEWAQRGCAGDGAAWGTLLKPHLCVSQAQQLSHIAPAERMEQLDS